MSGCKQCPAFAKCTAPTYRGSACAAIRRTYGMNGDPEIKTNADRIRDMSDEEMAETLCVAEFCDCCEYERDNGTCHYIELFPDGKLFDGCVLAALKWLQQPAEEETYG